MMIKSSIQQICIVFLLISIPFLFSQDDLEKARILLNTKKTEEAKTLLESMVITSPNDDRIHYYLGCAYLTLGDQDKAISHLKKAVTLKNDSAEYHFMLGQGYGIKAMRSNFVKQAGLAGKIRSEYEQAVLLNPTHLSARIQLTNFYLMAPGFMGGSTEKAYGQIQAILPMDRVRGKLLLAQYYQKEKKDSLAESEYKWLASQYGDSVQYAYIHSIYGYFLLEQKRPDEAVSLFKKLVALIPNQAYSYNNLGDGFRAAGQMEEAVAAYQKALEINPSSKTAKTRLQEVEKEIRKSKKTR